MRINTKNVFTKQSMRTSRRHFLRSSAAITLGFSGLQTLIGCRSSAAISTGTAPDGFGSLVPDPSGILDLPKGFSYTIISRHGERMDDGFYVPSAHDGMAAFPGPNGLTVLVRNHEIDWDAGAEQGPYGADQELFSRIDSGLLYDAGFDNEPCLGGTTTLLFDTRTQRLVTHFLSLAGTLRNCAGGPTPWNSWITCEETVARAGDKLRKDHGYCFEVPAEASPRVHAAEPLLDMGRFYHEAIAVDPVSGVVYMTEDRWDSLIYRFVPNVPGLLAEGGQLQALTIRDHPSMDTRNWDEQLVAPGDRFSVKWISMNDIHSPDDDLRLRGFDRGAARFARGEGMWYGNDAVYFACTNGGPARKGQIWKYIPSRYEGEEGESANPAGLELFIEPNDGGIVDNADNLTVSPWGDLIVCEDGPGTQNLVGITPAGKIYTFAHNAVSESEFAGSTFSPDGSTMFVNMQKDGLTLAIHGPWRNRRIV